MDSRIQMIIATIPCFNEEPFIHDIVSRAQKYVDQVAVIDDGSSDNTADIAKSAGAKVVRHSSNMGAGAATRSCFQAAREAQADVVVTLDGDGQHDPDEIPLVLEPILNRRADLVIGSRFMNKSISVPAYRKFGINVITWLFNLGSRTKVVDSQSCFRAYTREVIDNIPLTEKGFGFSVQLLIEARRRGFTIVEAPISCIYHENSHSLNPVVHGLGVALKVVELRLKGLTNRNHSQKS